MADTRGSHHRDPATLVIVAALVAWFWATVGSNLPVRQFDRLRRGDRTGPLVPNWRFFAPGPISYDYEVWYRTRTAGGVDPCWRMVLAPTPRRRTDAIWMPVRRRDKALMAIATELVRTAGAAGDSTGWAHAVLAAAAVAAARRETRANGGTPEVQFAVLKHDGYLGGGRRLAHLSDFQPVTGEPGVPRATGPGRALGAVSRNRQVVTEDIP